MGNDRAYTRRRANLRDSGEQYEGRGGWTRSGKGKWRSRFRLGKEDQQGQKVLMAAKENKDEGSGDETGADIAAPRKAEPSISQWEPARGDRKTLTMQQEYNTEGEDTGERERLLIRARPSRCRPTQSPQERSQETRESLPKGHASVCSRVSHNTKERTHSSSSRLPPHRPLASIGCSIQDHRPLDLARRQQCRRRRHIHLYPSLLDLLPTPARRGSH
jgi:hypothetical protein